MGKERKVSEKQSEWEYPSQVAGAYRSAKA